MSEGAVGQYSCGKSVCVLLHSYIIPVSIMCSGKLSATAAVFPISQYMLLDLIILSDLIIYIEILEILQLLC